MNTELKVSSQLRGFARRLVAEGLMEEQVAIDASFDASEKDLTILAWMIRNAGVEPEALATAASVEYGIPNIDIRAVDLSLAPLSLVDETLIEKHKAIPLYLRGNCLFLGVSDPTDQEVIDAISFSSGFRVEPIIVASSQLEHAIERALQSTASVFDEFEDEEGLEDIGFQLESTESEDDAFDPAVDETPVVKFVNKVLLDAIRKGASDIHFEPYEASYRIRYRLDGVLSTVANPPIQMSRRLSSRLKVMAGLDIAEKRVPQDGRIQLNLSRKKSIDFRVSTCPIMFGEKVVLRILDSAATRLGIEGLGFEQAQQDVFHASVLKPYGMILVTGPTGSGKTVSLYTALSILNDEGRNISTVEDPVEIRVPGINQVQQNAKQGMTFARALRSFLRQDPDVIMVGEIRDLETAEIAIKAAQTGHLVLSTLHTNDAPRTLTRLIDMGVKPYAIASTIQLIIAQRLARKLCVNCKEIRDVPKEALLQEGFTEQDIDANLKIYGPVGCKSCNDGYKGRLGIFQVLPISETIQRIIMEGGNAMQIADQAAAEGVLDLRAAGLQKVKDGLTGLEEINRVTIE